MRKSAIVAGTGFEGRARVVRRHCREGRQVILKREPRNKYDPNAIAVYLKVPRLGGLLGTALLQIGYIKAGTARHLAGHMDSGANITATVQSFWAPEPVEFPRVTLEVTDEV